MVMILKESIEREQSNDNLFKKLCEIYLLYFDEIIGHIPFLTCPENLLHNDEEKMRLIRFHPIWFLESQDPNSLNRVDLEYDNKMYFAKKFFIESNRTKRRAGLEHEVNEQIVLILVLPIDLDIFGSALINKLTGVIITEFQKILYQIIESEIAKGEIIKKDNLKVIIEEGDLIKERLRNMIKNVCNEYFSSVIKKKDPTTIKLQKAMSFLMLKGIDISYIAGDIEKNNFSNIRLFDYNKPVQALSQLRENFKIMQILINKDFDEFEIIVENHSSKDIIDLNVKITYIQEFFEKDILNESIELWSPNEKLIFIAPIVEGITDYLFFIIKKKHNTILFSRKISLNKTEKF